ncbi:MAG TPA: hypothetical protein VFM18_17885 [Methanosarcina sp.]|nr:hypothetical protein [Methanosarcina sp.]
MAEFYKFASDSPILTFFLFSIAGSTIVGVFQAFARAITGSPACCCDKDED